MRAAQKGIPTGSVYEVNERNLMSVGSSALHEMLASRDWGELSERKYEVHGGIDMYHDQK